MAGEVHTVFRDGQWRNELGGGPDLGGTHATKEQAVSTRRDEARQRGVEHMIHTTKTGRSARRTATATNPRSVPG
jgi:hypothetical protein